MLIVKCSEKTPRFLTVILETNSNYSAVGGKEDKMAAKEMKSELVNYKNN